MMAWLHDGAASVNYDAMSVNMRFLSRPRDRNVRLARMLRPGGSGQMLNRQLWQGRQRCNIRYRGFDRLL